MDVLALILACSLHPDDALVRTLVDVQSSGNVYFVGDLATLKTNDNLTSAADALRAAEEIGSHGGRPAVGLLGIPLDWAARFGRNPRDLFDACTNIAIGTAMLSSFDAVCAPHAASRAPKGNARRPRVLSRRPQARASAGVRACILTRFASELGVQGAPAEILKRTAVRATGGDAPTPAVSSAIFGDGVDDALGLPAEWSDRRIYLDASDVRASDPGSASSSQPAPRAVPGTPTGATRSPASLGPRPISVVGGSLPSISIAADSANKH
jgi:hypothetical protein